MDGGTWANIALVMVFILLGGIFAGTEMALVSLRETQVRELEKDEGRGRTVAGLARNPNTFLSAVQIGVTLSGFFSAAYGASTLAPDIAPYLMDLGMAPAAADTAAFIGMTLVVAYLSLVLGELTPKRLAMQSAVGFARALAPPLALFAKLMRPVIWLLSVSTNAMVRLLGGDPHASTEEMTQAEIQSMVQETTSLSEQSRRILGDVFEAGERLVQEVMRPRTAVAFLDGHTTVAGARDEVRTLPHTRYPVTGRDSDDILGFVHIRDLLYAPAQDSLDRVVRPMKVLPGTLNAVAALKQMQSAGDQIALVVDEYGGTDGIVTLEDLLEEVVGEIYDEFDAAGADPEDTVMRLADGGEVDGGLILQELERALGVDLPEGEYETVGGFLMARLGRVPEEGDEVEHEGYALSVVSMDGRRIDRIGVRRLDQGSTPASTRS